MARKFLDTSALVKLYTAEPDSPSVQIAVAPSDGVIIARLSVVEYRSAVYGAVRQGRLLLPDAQIRIGLFETDLPGYRVLPMVEEACWRAERLLDSHSVSKRLLPPDALIVAVALAEHRRTPIDAFVTTDKTQATVAAEEGLTVLPPVEPSTNGKTDRLS